MANYALPRPITEQIPPGLLRFLAELAVGTGQPQEIAPMPAMTAPVRTGVRTVMERFPLRGASAETVFNPAQNLARIRVGQSGEHIPHELGHVLQMINAPTTSRAYGKSVGREGGVLNRIRAKQQAGEVLTKSEQDWLGRNEFRTLANEGVSAAATRGKDQTPELLNLMAYLQRMSKDNVAKMKSLLVESIPGRVGNKNTSDISQIAKAILEFPQQSIELLTSQAGTPAKVRKQVRDVLDMLMAKQDAAKEFRAFLDRNVKPRENVPFRAGGGK